MSSDTGEMDRDCFRCGHLRHEHNDAGVCRAHSIARAEGCPCDDYKDGPSNRAMAEAISSTQWAAHASVLNKDGIIERVAMAIDAEVIASKKAIAAKSGQIRAVLDAVLWEKQSESYRNECRSIARAAVRAMRDPKQAMIWAGNGELDLHAAPSEEVTVSIWHAMIDEALKS